MHNRRFAVTATAALLLAAAGIATPARADLSFSLRDVTGDPGSAEVAAGQTFGVSLYLTATTELTVGLSYFLEDPSGLSAFRIVARDTTGSPYTDVITPNAVVLDPASALLDPRNDDDLGALVADLSAPLGPGEHLVATFTLQALPSLAPGTYTLQTSPNAAATDAAFSDLPIPPASFAVTVTPAATIPEPGSASLLLTGAMPLLARRRRRTRGT